ncbi:MAG: outer membrane protein assembly factor BamD [Calditrichia bacterium]
MKKGMFFLFILILGWSLTAGCNKTKSEKEYFDLAYQHMGKEQWSEAENNFQKILEEYPNGVYSSKSLFMVAFINANYIQNYEKAKEYYSKFLQKYPNHELASSAKYELENLGKNPDDMPFWREENSDNDSSSQNAQKETASIED